MFRIEIIRNHLTIRGCFGELFLFDEDNKLVFTCQTLEPIQEGLEPDKNLRIPAGEYRTRWYRSYRFNRLLLCLYNQSVPYSRHILIHVGNYVENTAGCILVGSRRTREGLVESRKALKELHDFIFEECVRVYIKNDLK